MKRSVVRKILSVNLDTVGLNTQSDPEDSMATSLVNVELDQPGRIYKRQGRSYVMHLNATTITDIIKWVPQRQSSVWVAYDSQRGRLIKFTEGV